VAINGGTIDTWTINGPEEEDLGDVVVVVPEPVVHGHGGQGRYVDPWEPEVDPWAWRRVTIPIEAASESFGIMRIEVTRPRVSFVIRAVGESSGAASVRHVMPRVAFALHSAAEAMAAHDVMIGTRWTSANQLDMEDDLFVLSTAYELMNDWETA
jgi:hypothetical protein